MMMHWKENMAREAFNKNVSDQPYDELSREGRAISETLRKPS
jgi:hypothetical protein